MAAETGAVSVGGTNTPWLDRGEAQASPKEIQNEKLKKTDVFTYAANAQAGGFKL